MVCIPGSKPKMRHRTVRPHMKEPSKSPDNDAAVIAVPATIRNLVNAHEDINALRRLRTNMLKPVLCLPSPLGRGITRRGERKLKGIRRALSIARASDEVFTVPVCRGNIIPSRRETHADTKATLMVCTCTRFILPVIMELRTAGSSSSPTLAAVPSRAERFISMLPLRLRRTGIIRMSWSSSLMARHRCVKS